MDERLTAAEDALRAGRTEEGVGLIEQVLEANPDQTAQVYRVLLIQLYRLGRHQEGEVWSARAVERHPREVEIWNLRGVFLRQLRRYLEALAAFDQAIKISPNLAGPQNNRGNVLLDLNQAAAAEAAFSKLARSDPRNPEYQRQLGRALAKQGRVDQAMVRWRQAVAVKKDYLEGWLDMAGAFSDQHKIDRAMEVLDKAVAANPDASRLHEARAVIYRRAGELRKAEAYLKDLEAKFPGAAWIQYQLGVTVTDYDRERANAHLRRAVELEPDKLEPRMALIESVERTRTGDEGANIEEAYHLLKATLAKETLTSPGHLKIAAEVLIRVCDFDAFDQLGSFREVGRAWAENGRHTALMKQLARVKTPDDRLELIEQHRIWGRATEATAAQSPIRRPAGRRPSQKIRLGLMSSDLRRHPVGYFALPLFDHLDSERFELFCYSYYQGQADPVQQHMAAKATGFRWRPDISPRDAAQMIADDQLDMLIELGGSTHMNKLEAMAWRPAARQASWVGYPHSAGLSAIDYFVCDPFILPEARELLIEEPMVLRNAWYPLAPAIFRAEIPVDLQPPTARNGYVTFGTANNPGKYTRETFAAWAQVMAACPNSRFLFIRPEGGTKSFRENSCALFAAHGISPDRIDFEAVRGAHLPHYNRLDMSLDCFPQTGGTTTCESLWMGAPCVSLVGPAPYERLSYSVLGNLGLTELCADDVAGYVKIAVELAHDPKRIGELRSGMRERMRLSPLGRTDQWARDFYDVVAEAVTGQLKAPAARHRV